METPPSGDDTPDWLRELRGDMEAAPAEHAADTPDWLARIREDGQQNQPIEPDLTPAEPAEDVPDWLRDLSPAAAPQSAPAESGDWLQALQSSSETPPLAETPAEPAAESDWLSEFRTSEPPAGGEMETPPAEMPETPDLSQWLSSLDADETVPSAEPAGETPDWLSGLQAPAAETPAETPAEPAGEAPDWLSGLQAPAAETPAEPAGEAPDWLSGLQAPAAETPAEPAGEAPDWLSGLQAPAAETPAETPAEPAGETPDWLRGLQAPAAETPAETPAEPAGEAPDWLSGLQAPAAETPAEPAGEAPDWLSGLQAPAAETPAEPAGEAPDWLSGLQAPAAETPAEPAGESPDWLSGLQAPAAETPAEPAGETPDWLSGLQAPAAETPAEPAGETPDWLGFQAPAPETPAEPVAETPDWLSGLQAVEPETPAEPAASEPAPTDLPPWLSSLPVESTAPEEPIPPMPEPADLPSWLTGTPAAEPAPVAEIPAEPLDSGLPDWLSQMPAAPESAPESAAAPEGTLPDWYAAPPAAEPEEPAPAQPVSPFMGEGLPEWLSQMPTPKIGEPAALPEPAPFELPAEMGIELPPSFADIQPPAPVAPAGESLEPAMLPTWLEAMRPVESVVPGATGTVDDRIESAGPLAGIQGVLTSEELASRYLKPPTYSSRLRVTERQRAHAELLESFIEEKSRPRGAQPETGLVPRAVLRILIAAIMLVILLAPLLGGLQLTALPGASPEVSAFNTQMQQLTAAGESPRVLLAVDYEPGLAGEMQLISVGAVESLMQMNARIITLSTSPTGTALADQLLRTALQDIPAYPLVDQTISLGYLPGGESGLAQFANSPQQALPYTTDGQSAWSLPVLEGTASLSDFDALLLLTDSPDVARSWIEQVQPSLGDVPLLVISSAQAAPLILPYVQSNQVDGLVGGLYGSAAYDQLAQRPGSTARSLWDSYQIGMLLIVVFILVGGLYYAISRMLGRRKTRKPRREA